MTTACLLQLLVFSTAQAAPADVGPDQYLRIVRSSYADVRDISFVYEGTRKYVYPGGPAEFGDQRNYQFDGNYIWRSDGSIINDVYMRWDNGKDFLHVSENFFRGKSIRFRRNPDRTAPPYLSEVPASPLAIGGENGPSPHYLIWFWYYHMITDAAAFKYRDLGWDTVDGRRCLKVELDCSYIPPEHKNSNNMSRYRFWLDLERGAQPLRVDWLIFLPHVAVTIHPIELESFPISGTKRLWLPVSAVEETYLLTQNSYSKEPVHRNTVRIVQSSLRINQSIPDSKFVVRDTKPDGKTGRVLQREFDEHFIKSPPAPPSDPKSIEDHLAKLLAEADQQSKMIEASSPSNAFWTPTLFMQLGLFGVGAALIAGFIIVRQRTR